MNLFIKIPAILFALLFANNVIAQTYTDTIPLGGNAYTNAPAAITDDGLTSWASPSTITSIYFRINVPQTFDVSLRMQAPKGKSEISVSANNTTFKKQFQQPVSGVVHIGKFNIAKPGYVKIDLKGISKTGNVYADVSDLIIQYTKKDTGIVYVKHGSSFHFGRRGPSVHLRYDVPENLKNNISWFYNELTIPEGNDKPGSYFMADGFGEGYFGMQVNSETERRILFSVWSPFETDDPKSIPDSMKILLRKKGEAVNTNNFGGEGSGGQSFMRFNWKAGNTYGFLLHAEPDSIHRTTAYTAYFKDIAAAKWYLIASFKRPQTTTYITHLYSFLENFIPETGNETRMGFYKNQWIANNSGEWHELINATFTIDATAKGGYRKDYAGGVDGDKFFLKNDGFFNEFVQPYQSFKRHASNKKPEIIFAQLPQQ
jgi:hypothetical protein